MAERMEYELINPSDPYTFIAEDFETAAIVVFVLGLAYGGKPKCGNGEIPVFLFAGADVANEWYKEQFGRTPDAGLEEKKKAVAEALLSFMLGQFEDRERYEAALAAITDVEKRKEFIAVWQDGRTSLNNIGDTARNIGQKLQEQYTLTGGTAK